MWKSHSKVHKNLPFFINRPHIKDIWRIVYGSFSRSLKQCMMRFRPNLLLFSLRPSIPEADGSTLVTQRKKTIGRSDHSTSVKSEVPTTAELNYYKGWHCRNYSTSLQWAQWQSRNFIVVVNVFFFLLFFLNLFYNVCHFFYIV